MILTLTAPNRSESFNPRFFTIFLAGGISGCPDWQTEIIDKFVDRDIQGYVPDILLFNPRREEFDLSDATQTEIQIKWEFDHLRTADIVLFWFPKDSLCPIALFELGVELGKRQSDTYKGLFVGCDPEYPRKQDIVIQYDLVSGSPIFTDMETMVDATVAYIQWLSKK